MYKPNRVGKVLDIRTYRVVTHRLIIYIYIYIVLVRWWHNGNIIYYIVTILYEKDDVSLDKFTAVSIVSENIREGQIGYLYEKTKMAIYSSGYQYST